MADVHTDDPLVTRDEITAARRRIDGRVLRTPLVPLGDSGVVVKAESLQRTGAFKLRGALNAMLQLDDQQRARGVVAHSSGNHAVAVACAGRMLGIPTVVVMPDDAPRVKADAARSFGAEIVVVGPASSERAARAREIAADRGLAPVEPYDSRDVVAATGTIALEILEDLPGAREIYVPVSGGGLIAGIARAAHLIDPTVRVVGVEPEVAADALASLRAGQQVTLPADQMARTSADGLRVQRVGDIPWRHLQRHVDEIVTVSEAEITATIGRLATQARLVAEPSGATAVAAALAAVQDRGPGHPVVALLSGGNIEPITLRDVVDALRP